MNFDLNSQARHELGSRLIDVVDNYFGSLPDRPVQVAAEQRVHSQRLSRIPETGDDAVKVFDGLCRELIDSGFHIPSAHYLGMMNPTPTYVAFLAESLVAALNPQLATVARSQLASAIEAETVGWIGELVGWSSEFSGTFTTGGNEANFSALALALSRGFPGVVENGVAACAAQPVLYASVEGHHSLDKSTGLLGLGRRALRRIPVNDSLQLNVEELAAAIERDLAAGNTPFCVVGTAGTTSSGAIDQLPLIAEICRRHDIWFHVDGAYGAAVLFSDRHRHLVRGIEHADSITLDPHKWLAMPFSAGLMLTRHPELLAPTFSVPCPYLQKTAESNLPDNLSISAQWSRRMNSLKLWLTLKVHGRRAYQELVDRQIELARCFAQWVAASDIFELAAPQVLPILNLRLRAPGISDQEMGALHAAIIEEVNRDGQRWISGATVNGKSVIRTMIISYLTGERHLEGLQEALQAAALKIGRWQRRALDANGICPKGLTGSATMCVHTLIEAQARATPDAIAVVEEGKQLTYRQLDDRATELASLLSSLGVGKETLVALCMQRSAAFVIGALGILKAGAAYLPLDPADPANRLTMLLEDSQCHFVVTQSSIAESLPAGNWEKIVLDKNGALPCRGSEVPATNDVKSDDLAYVIFTSGSTGRPKGVEITHANLLNLIRWHIRTFQVTSADKATMQASPGFDAAVWELWPYLAAGATIHIIDDAIRTRPERLRNWIVETGITVSFLPTALAEAMIALPWPPNTSLRFLLTGADVLHRYPPPDLPFALVNNYGPTECTVVATSGVVPSDAKPGELPTIGQAIDGARIYIVDEQMKPVPEGMSGEMLIGGAGVGRGYINLPELTAQRFLPDPFVTAEPSRLYRTGDLARRLPDGQIMFLGRMDDQVKVRGYRIEPGEISAVLNRHPGVETTCVIARAEEPGEPRLVAYVVMKPDSDLHASELRNSLASHLPEYMVPSKFIKIARLPLTTHGKVDRAALPAPTAENVLADPRFEPPQSEVEHWLAALLMNLLGVDRIGRDDNFFRLGGHSLMGAQLIAKIQERFGVELSLRSLFDHPSVHGIASEIDNLIRTQLNAMSDEEARRVLDTLSGGVPI
jgi:amino acid adenylation domain-containing protein